MNPGPHRQIRVAIVAASLRYVGGHSAQADYLLSRWRNDPEVEASLIVIDPSIPGTMQWLMRVPFVRTMVREPLYLAALWRGLKDVDIAHIFSASYWSFWIAPVPARLIARLLKKQALIHYHSGEAEGHLRRSRLSRSVLKGSDRLIVPSRYLVDVFRKFGLRAQAVPNVVDLQQFPFRVRRPLRPNLICTRGFHRYYRVDLVVEAFALIQKRFPGAHLHLLGEGAEEGKIRDLVKRLDLKTVNFAGVVSRYEIPHHYSAADIFINASCVDNMPVSILEAFASGTPVVSTAPEGLKYLIEHEHTGLLSEVGDANALAHNVIRLLEETDLSHKIAVNALETCKTYTWPQVRSQWRDLYFSLVGRDHKKWEELAEVH